MRILIVEDETAAYENLADMLVTIDPTIEIMGNTESVRQTVRWLQANPRPDLIFMDIHLSDGSAFAIFDQIEVEAPCFYTADKSTYVYLKTGNSYPYAKTLEQIISSLSPADFIRANKQFIISRDSVKDITIWFDSRLLVTLDIEVPERIYISKNKASEFKSWIVSLE